MKRAGAPHKVIISGTGRSGTTLLMQLLTWLGLDTGYSDIRDGIFEIAHAGMEKTLEEPDSPYILKSPWFCMSLHQYLLERKLVVDHLFIPMRHLPDAAASRVAVQQLAGATGTLGGDEVPGGLWGTAAPAQQIHVLARRFFRLMYAVAVFELPHTFLEFPRFGRDPKYLYRKLKPVLGDIPYARFLAAYTNVVDATLIHEFNERRSA